MYRMEKPSPRRIALLTIPRNPPAAALRAIDTALWVAEREERRLIARVESKDSSANQRFQAHVELAFFSRQIVIPLTDSAAESPVDSKSPTTDETPR
jgi:hypothetical protein